MKKIIFEVSEDMFRKIDSAMVREGFPTRSEFLRYLIVDYCKANMIRAGCCNQESEGTQDEQGEEEEGIFGKYAFGIPPKELELIKEKARQMTENERQQLS